MKRNKKTVNPYCRVGAYYTEFELNTSRWHIIVLSRFLIQLDMKPCTNASSGNRHFFPK